ncbi:hypothetical protein PTSG_04816 [Salpingoeca rosetta]|uniref:TNFR-Cys domain-containing protein n=1 Tax=Salpingoeca rosetta (strain ATCC 50818 / BSB-021) TaxID=946362 RepID=F2U9S6_SALR5|nr:uncharacterized protein PTSG_04816 [Salpingoeca rosetta]EGD73103.1 hypothetical protein PTSG_04816 [Salpingoeca rosetta]|eukprot:XP_004994134.1 hypothetical protein PTSG_04816 [Salpingoeca rosetta]
MMMRLRIRLRRNNRVGGGGVFAVAVLLAVVVIALLAGAQAQDVDCSTEPDNTPCDDGSSLTDNDRCQGGSCVGVCRRYEFNGQCLSSCPSGYVEDTNTCSELHEECGSHCLDCADNGKSCARCQRSKYLEDGECRDECSIKSSSGENSFRTETNPYGRYCNTPPPTETVLSETVIIGIAAGGGALVLLIVCVVVYITCDRRRSRLRLELDAEDDNTPHRQPSTRSDTESIALSTFPPPPEFSDNTSVFATASSPSGVSDKQKKKWQKTVRRLSQSQALDATTMDISAQTQHIIDNMHTATLDASTAQHVFARLAEMRHDRALYFVLLKDMQRRQKKKAGQHQSTERYDRLIADLTIVLQLFQQSKSNRTFPVDCMRLLDWAQSTLDKYVSARAAKMGATVESSES